MQLAVLSASGMCAIESFCLHVDHGEVLPFSSKGASLWQLALCFLPRLSDHLYLCLIICCSIQSTLHLPAVPCTTQIPVAGGKTEAHRKRVEPRTARTQIHAVLPGCRARVYVAAPNAAVARVLIDYSWSCDCPVCKCKYDSF